MPKKPVERVHTAKAEVKVHDLTKRGTSIKVELYADKERLGTLLIGRGSFTWKGKGQKGGIPSHGRILPASSKLRAPCRARPSSD